MEFDSLGKWIIFHLLGHVYPGSRGPNAEREGEGEGEGEQKEKPEGPLASAIEISLPCQYLVQILNLVSDWLLN